MIKNFSQNLSWHPTFTPGYEKKIKLETMENTTQNDWIEGKKD